jgi:hypothetical protein
VWSAYTRKWYGGKYNCVNWEYAGIKMALFNSKTNETVFAPVIILSNCNLDIFSTGVPTVHLKDSTLYKCENNVQYPSADYYITEPYVAGSSPVTQSTSI